MKTVSYLGLHVAYRCPPKFAKPNTPKLSCPLLECFMTTSYRGSTTCIMTCAGTTPAWMDEDEEVPECDTKKNTEEDTEEEGAAPF